MGETRQGFWKRFNVEITRLYEVQEYGSLEYNDDWLSNEIQYLCRKEREGFLLEC